MLTNHHPLPQNSRNYQLIGNLKDYRKCHLGEDWLLIYQPSTDTVTFVRTGSHSEPLD